MQDVPWLSDEEQRLWRSILNAKRAVDRSIDLQLQDSLDISTADFSVLVALSEAETMLSACAPCVSPWNGTAAECRTKLLAWSDAD